MRQHRVGFPNHLCQERFAAIRPVRGRHGNFKRGLTNRDSLAGPESRMTVFQRTLVDRNRVLASMAECNTKSQDSTADGKILGLVKSVLIAPS